YKNSCYTRKLTLTKKLISTSEETVTEFKVVGVYYDVTNTYSINELAPILASSEALEGLGVSLNQGRYTRMLSTMNTTSQTGTELSDYITATQGLTLYLYGNDVLSTLEYSETQILQFTNLFLYASLVLALFSMFMLFNYISTSIASKRQSIGILRALGSNRLDVFKMFLTESLIISTISAIAASVLSYFACDFVNVYIKDIMSLMVNFAIYGVRQIIIIFVIGIFTGILASIIPIIKIAREKPVDLIRRL
ncbi:MAG: FtsX-like permease family protein, partial [Clostridia bacterium]|nr:FtsX-like permease family protein [Clostridia bacterium]